MKLKRLLAICIAVVMTVGMIPVFVLASEGESEPEETAKVEAAESEDEAAEEKADEQLPSENHNVPAQDAKKKKKQPFSYNWNGTVLTISGDCAMPDFKDGAPWEKYREDIKKVVIKKGITSVSLGAFAKCTNLAEVSIPSTVNKIDDYAFNNCTGLTKVSIPNGVTSIGLDAFRRCDSLTEITIPGTVKTMGFWAFAESGLKKVTISNGVKELKQGAFYYCKELTSVTIPASLKIIGKQAFENCEKLSGIKLNYGLEYIGEMAFYECKAFTSVTIPSSVTNIDTDAFEGCEKLYSAYISGALISKYNDILKSAFSRCPQVQIIPLLDNTMAVTGNTAKVKYKKVKKKAQTVSASKLFKFTDKGQGSYLFSKVKGNKKISINKTSGKVTVKKKLKKGTYKVQVKVLATGNTTTAASSWQTVTIKIKVK